MLYLGLLCFTLVAVGVNAAKPYATCTRLTQTEMYVKLSPDNPMAHATFANSPPRPVKLYNPDVGVVEGCSAVVASNPPPLFALNYDDCGVTVDWSADGKGIVTIPIRAETLGKNTQRFDFEVSCDYPFPRADTEPSDSDSEALKFLTDDDKTFTISTPSKPKGFRGNDTCSGRGTGYCECDTGFVGEHCETERDYCAELTNGMVINQGTNRTSICGEHGVCQNEREGAFCKCDEGFTGEFCQHIHNGSYVLAKRCLVYAPKHGLTADVQVGCPDLDGQQCVPEDLECFYRQCDYPIGWCIPVVEVQHSRFSRFISALSSK